jgi:hypothetical protein
MRVIMIIKGLRGMGGPGSHYTPTEGRVTDPDSLATIQPASYSNSSIKSLRISSRNREGRITSVTHRCRTRACVSTSRLRAGPRNLSAASGSPCLGARGYTMGRDEKDRF